MDATSTPISSISNTTDTMRTEAEFIEQAELARTALQQFVAIQDFNNADDLKRGALNKLMKSTVSFSPIYSVFFRIVITFTSFHSTVLSSLLTIPCFSKFRPLSTKSLPIFTRSTPVLHFRRIFQRLMGSVIVSTTISRVPSIGKVICPFYFIVFY